jgi:hypothetical protein
MIAFFIMTEIICQGQGNNQEERLCQVDKNIFAH